MQRLKTILNLLNKAEEQLYHLYDLSDKQDDSVKETILGIHSVKELVKTQFKEFETCKNKIKQLLD